MVAINKGKIIIFSNFNKKHYYLILFVFCSILRRVLPLLIETTDLASLNKKNFNKNCIFDMISNFASDFLAGIYKLIQCFKNNKNKKGKIIDDEENNDTRIRRNDSSISEKVREAENQKEKQKKLMKYRFFNIMLIIAVIDIIAQLCLFFFSYIDVEGCTLSFTNCGEDKDESKKARINEDDLLFTSAINIIFRYIFSRCLLTVYIYRHHFISMIITFISFISLSIFHYNK